MPILDVEVVTEDKEALAANLAPLLAEAAGQIFGLPAGQTWVRLRTLPRGNYAEDGGGPPTGVHPVFVSVLVARHPPPDRLKAEIGRLTEAIARICSRPAQNVHVVYRQEGRGRVAFGGMLVE